MNANATTINALSLSELQAMPLVDVGRHIAILDREHDRVIKEERAAEDVAPGCLSDEIGDLLFEFDDRVLARSPETVADAAVLLLAVSSSFHSVMSDLEYRETMMDPWLAMGRIIGFLAKAGKVDPVDVGSSYWTSSVDGLDPRLAAEWWIQRFLQNGGTLILNERGGVGLYSPEGDAEQTEGFRLLFEEHPSLDKDTIENFVGRLAWRGLGCDGLFHDTIPGRRWAIAWQPNRTAETCIITTQIVTDRPLPDAEGKP